MFFSSSILHSASIRILTRYHKVLEIKQWLVKKTHTHTQVSKNQAFIWLLIF
jgi:hypothetical protein